MSREVVAVSVSRWRFEEGIVARWWYEVTLVGARGACYEVKILHSDGKRPIPFKAIRSGRTTRGMGSSSDLRRALEAVAVEAIAA